MRRRAARSLEMLEDPLVDRLVWRAIAAGVGAVIQHVPRAVIDCNRDEDGGRSGADRRESARRRSGRARATGWGWCRREPIATARCGAGRSTAPNSTGASNRSIGPITRRIGVRSRRSRSRIRRGRSCSIAIRCRRPARPGGNGDRRPPRTSPPRHGSPRKRRGLSGRRGFRRRSTIPMPAERSSRAMAGRPTAFMRIQLEIDRSTLSDRDGRNAGRRVSTASPAWSRRSGLGLGQRCSTAAFATPPNKKEAAQDGLDGRKSGRNAPDGACRSPFG